MAAMDTDEQHNQSSPQTNLRRSNSAPLINGANISEASVTFLPTLTPRQRRSSTSQMANHNHNGLPVVPVGSPHSRLHQIRKEEFMDETEQDRIVNTSLLLSTSCDELSLMNQNRRTLYSPLNCDDRRHSIDDPTHYFPSSTASSPSPTRGVGSTLPRPIPRARSSSPCPSPTRQISRRSLSPILIKQSTFNHKRKFFSNGLDVGVSPSKRAFSDTSMQHSSSSDDNTCDSTHLPFSTDDDSGIETTTPATPVTSMLFCDTSQPRLPYCRPKYTPPRSPLARSLSTNSNEAIKRFSLDGQPCFTFAPVKD